MNLTWLLGFLLFLACSGWADYASKMYSSAHTFFWWAMAMLGYLAGVSFWLMSIKAAYGLARGGAVFDLGLIVLCILLGRFVFKESMTHSQMVGAGLAVVAAYLMLRGQ